MPIARCPFCGEVGKLRYTQGSYGYYDSTSRVECSSGFCRAQGPVAIGENDADSACRQRSVELWNKRYGLPN